MRDIVIGPSAHLKDEIEDLKKTQAKPQNDINANMIARMDAMRDNINNLNMQAGVLKSTVDAYSSVVDLQVITNRIKNMEKDLADIRKVYVVNTAQTLMQVADMKIQHDKDKEVFVNMLEILSRRIEDVSKK
jgi:citrate synthase